ncbi:HAMP domain-containing sensor histidine kinase [Paraliomyxa miuraensis]|uniref:HAMP domain-containing sensor histidine kinase n=1 Tax=Paraliomyxa miuraensis TaxID=376150 RepID=UPI00224FA143|nr:HAMP domain-containing sensor histidine kinase [Paraliomyxa miuraensis]MCX4240654.1 HAMP domain-containing histidine kinase [Paraliomyxa miuraensis]
MRLLTRLLLSHLLPLVIVVCALGLTLVSLLRITAALDDLERGELGALRREGELHRAAWTLDVSMRHGEDDCREGRAAPVIRDRIQVNADEVDAALVRIQNVSTPMKEVIEDYLSVARELLAQDVCQGLLTERIDNQREELDEHLTDLWIARLDELHEQVTEKRADARKAGGAALVGGAMVALLASLLAVSIATWLTRVVNRPLRALADSARGVGRGDFGTPVHVDGPPEFVELAGVLEQMRLQLGQLEQLKQGFLASISHELRTPLAKVREALALLQDGVVGTLDERQLDVVKIGRSACEREIRLVTTLLDLSRLRAGSPVRPRDGSSIDDVIQHAVADERPEAELRRVAIEVSAKGEAPGCHMDPILVERAIANLVRNAAAVSSAGQTVEVRRELVVGERVGAERWIRISVHDEGPGVPPEIRESVFETFVTHPVPNSGKGFGFGLGLALSREVARAHGGELLLDTTRERGATFQLWLPLAADEPHD